MSSRRAKGRVSHTKRYAITATQADLDAATARKPWRTGPRHGQRLAQTMREAACFQSLVGPRGHGQRLRMASHMLAARERNLRDELDDLRVSIAQRHDPKLTRRYIDPVAAVRANKAGA